VSFTPKVLEAIAAVTDASLALLNCRRRADSLIYATTLAEYYGRAVRTDRYLFGQMVQMKCWRKCVPCLLQHWQTAAVSGYRYSFYPCTGGLLMALSRSPLPWPPTSSNR